MLGHAYICLDTEQIPSRWLRTSPDSSEGPLSLNLTSRRFLSPLDTGPIRRLPEGLRPAAGTHGPPPARDPARDGAGAAEEGRACNLTERRNLRLLRHVDCAFRSRRRPGGAGRNPPPACGALWKMAQLGKCARATPRQAAGGVAPGPAGLGLGPGCTERRSLGREPR